MPTRGRASHRGLAVFYSACVSSMLVMLLETQLCWNNNQDPSLHRWPAALSSVWRKGFFCQVSSSFRALWLARGRLAWGGGGGGRYSCWVGVESRPSERCHPQVVESVRAGDFSRRTCFPPLSLSGLPLLPPASLGLGAS